MVRRCGVALLLLTCLACESASAPADSDLISSPTADTASDRTAPDPGTHCFAIDDSLIAYIVLTIEGDESVEGRSIASLDGGVTFATSQTFDGRLAGGKTANLNVRTSGEGQAIETIESWTFVDSGIRQGSRMFNYEECSRVIPFFE